MAIFLDSVLPGLQGIQNTQAQSLEMQAFKQRQADDLAAQDLLADYQKTGNQDALVGAVMKSPQLANNVLSTIGLVDKQKQQSAASDIAELWQLKDNPEAFKRKIAVRANAILERGGDPQNTLQLAALYEQDPMAAIGEMKAVAAGLESKGYQTGVFGTAQQDTPTSQKEFEYYQKLMQVNPAAAEKFARAKGYIETGREENRTEAQRNLSEYQRLLASNPEMAKQFGQSVGLVSKEGKELSAQAQKRLSDFIDTAVESGRLEQRYSTLANDFEKANIGGGIRTSWGEWLSEQTGEQDEISALRKEYLKIRGAEVVNNLPPGAASDTDVNMALAGFPTDKANSKQIAEFLRGLAKLKGFERQYSEFKANYISENGTERGMLNAWKEEQAKKQPAQEQPKLEAKPRSEMDILSQYGVN